jgi:hypothetical protein
MRALTCSVFAAHYSLPDYLQLATFLSCGNVYMDCFEAVQVTLLVNVRPCGSNRESCSKRGSAMLPVCRLAFCEPGYPMTTYDAMTR